MELTLAEAIKYIKSVESDDSLRTIEAWGKIYPAVTNMVRRISHCHCRSWAMGCHHAVMDVVQDAILRIHRSAEPIRSNPVGVLVRACKAAVVDRARHAGRIKRGGGRVHVPYDELPASDQDDAEQARKAIVAEASLGSSASKENCDPMAIISKLQVSGKISAPEAAFIIRKLDGYTIPKTAQALGCSQSSISRISRQIKAKKLSISNLFHSDSFASG